LSDVLKGLALDMAEIALKAAGNALLESILGGLFGGGGLGPQFTGTGTLGLLSSGSFAKGAAFAPGSVMARNIKAFARGGIVDTPEAFAFTHGLGVMGEVGPEAILPLARARSGELGVRAIIGRQPEAGGSAPAAAGMTFNIDARGADREGLARVERKVHELRGDLIRVNQSIEPRALRAWLETRRRGGFR
jgi:lambda family phage tail tape measure protein